MNDISGASLDIESVTHRFGGVVALAGVTLTVAKGSVHSLIGPNGAGKTTLINIVSGLYRPTSGLVKIDNVTTKWASLDSAARNGIVRTFQSIKTFGDMNVLDHVLIGLSGRERLLLWGITVRSKRGIERQGDLQRRAEEVLDLVGIRHLASLPACALSHGQRRLLEIARALSASPRVLLLDEPAAGLIGEEIRHLALLIERLKKSGMTILLVEHNMDLVLSVSDDVTVLDHGTVIAHGPPHHVQRDERVIAAYLGAVNADS